MKKAEAIKLRDEYRTKLIGKLVYEDRPDWEIKDVIVSNNLNDVGNVYLKMDNDGISNEEALSGFEIEENGYDVYIISHQWPWGSNDLLTENLDSYLKANPS